MHHEEIYSISELANLTGIKAHTIRIWEKRYGILQPCRDCNNKRTYSQEQKHKLIKISCLYNRGQKISTLAKMTNEELEKEYAQYLVLEQPAQVHLDTINLMIECLEESKIFNYFNKIFTKFGSDDFINECVQPLYARINLLYLTERNSKQHFQFFKQMVISFLDFKLIELSLQTQFNKEKILIVPTEISFTDRVLLHSLKYKLTKNGYRLSHLSMRDLNNNVEHRDRLLQDPSPYVIFCNKCNHEEVDRLFAFGPKKAAHLDFHISGPMAYMIQKQ